MSLDKKRRAQYFSYHLTGGEKIHSLELNLPMTQIRIILKTSMMFLPNMKSGLRDMLLGNSSKKSIKERRTACSPL